MITKFKIFEIDHSDIDPYGEEMWGENLIPATLNNIKVGDLLYCDNEFYGKVEKISEKWINIRIIDRGLLAIGSHRFNKYLFLKEKDKDES